MKIKFRRRELERLSELVTINSNTILALEASGVLIMYSSQHHLQHQDG